MKKNLIAGAILGILSTAAFAQSNVTVYGVIDVGVQYDRHGVNDGKSNVSLNSGIANGSRIGFKGREDLGGGLSALFQIENGFQADTGKQSDPGALFNRQSLVGLSGGFGTVTLGRQYTSTHIIADSADPFGTGLSGTVTSLVDYQTRVNNSVFYASPTINGVSGDLQYGFGEKAGNASLGRYLGASAGYANKDLYVRAGYAQATDEVVSSQKTKQFILGATYDFGPAKLHGLYTQQKADKNGTKFDGYLIGTSVPFGAHKLLASVVFYKDKSNVKKGNATQFALGYTYDLSKRTGLYASLAAIKNNDQQKFVTTNAMNAGTGNQALTFGIRHFF